MSTPTTKAGRDLLDILDRHGVSDDLNVGLGDILAIEAEAAATERRLTVERVWTVFEHGGPSHDKDGCHAALRSILDDLATADVDEEPQP